MTYIRQSGFRIPLDTLMTCSHSFFESEIAKHLSIRILKKTTENVHKLSYLDIEITILNSHFHSTVFDKQESFNF